jgi:hypothetical protein
MAGNEHFTGWKDIIGLGNLTYTYSALRGMALSSFLPRFNGRDGIGTFLEIGGKPDIGVDGMDGGRAWMDGSLLCQLPY